jgi:hypothetical protein
LLAVLPDFSSYNLPKQKNIPNDHKNIPNGHKIYQHFSFQDPPKITQIGIFGLKIYHLATLPRRCAEKKLKKFSRLEMF